MAGEPPFFSGVQMPEPNSSSTWPESVWLVSRRDRASSNHAGETKGGSYEIPAICCCDDRVPGLWLRHLRGSQFRRRPDRRGKCGRQLGRIRGLGWLLCGCFHGAPAGGGEGDRES